MLDICPPNSTMIPHGQTSEMRHQMNSTDTAAKAVAVMATKCSNASYEHCRDSGQLDSATELRASSTLLLKKPARHQCDSPLHQEMLPSVFVCKCLSSSCGPCQPISGPEENSHSSCATMTIQHLHSWLGRTKILFGVRLNKKPLRSWKAI